MSKITGYIVILDDDQLVGAWELEDDETIDDFEWIIYKVFLDKNAALDAAVAASDAIPEYNERKEEGSVYLHRCRKILV